MKSRYGKKGFTLIEILVAVTIIAAIVSMVYGSYFATSKSVQACKSRIALSRQARKVLEQMARQIRCSYVGPAKKNENRYGPLSQQREKINENEISYFNGNSGERGGDFLHLVTTSDISSGNAAPDGLFETTYKFEKSIGTLFVSRQRFVNAPKSLAENRNWWPLVSNIEYIELEFSDGRQWLHTWDFTQNKSLPNAVRINIALEDENFRQYHYGTIAYLCCRKNQGNKNIETLVSVNR
jgi:general secretion pathway protein J